MGIIMVGIGRLYTEKRVEESVVASNFASLSYL